MEDYNKVLKRYELRKMKQIRMHELFKFASERYDISSYRLKRLSTFRTLFFLYFMIYFSIGILPGNIDNLLLTLPHTSKIGIGILITTSLFTGMISILVFGYYSDKLLEKISRKKLFTITNLVWIFGYGLFSLSFNYSVLLFFTIISAIGTGAFLPIGFSIISDFYPPNERGNKFGIMQFGFLLGNGSGIIFGGILGSLFNSNGWRLAYILCFLLGVITVIMFSLRSSDPKRGQNEPEFEDMKVKLNYDYKITLTTVFQLFHKKSIMFIFLSVLCSGIALSTIGNWGVFYLTTKINSVNAEGLAIMLYLMVGLGGLPGTIIGGKIGDSSLEIGNKRGRVIISFTGLLCGISLLLVFYLIPFFTWNTLLFFVSWILFLPLGLFGYCFSYFSVGNQFAIYSEVCVPEQRNTANAMNGLMINVGGIIGNLIISSLIETNLSLLPFAIFLVLIIWLGGSFLWIIPYFYYPLEAMKCNALLMKRRNELENLIIE